MSQRMSYGLLGFIVMLAGCGPESQRPAQLVPESTALDARLSCEHLRGEYGMNGRRIAEIGGAEAGREGANAGRVLASGVLVGAMTRDDGRRAAAEGASLERRNARLRVLAAQRGCPL